jgi:isovaleryl-CoA dehydrogenase
MGLTEPGAGSDALGGMRTTARRDGDQHVLNGGKLFITNGPIADVVLTYAKPTPNGVHRGSRRCCGRSARAPTRSQH